MKKIIWIMCMIMMGVVSAQKMEPTFERKGDLVKATYYHDNGNVKQQGYFKEKKLTGTWISYDENGLKTSIAKYKNGKRVGKWIIWGYDGIKEITYKNNRITAVEAWKGDVNNIAVK